MSEKDLKINFRYLTGNVACMSVDSVSGKSVHNDIDNEEAIILFNSLVGEKEGCRTIKTLLQENKQLKEKVGELTQSLNEQMKETNKESLDCSKYAIENQQLKELINGIREERDYLFNKSSVENKQIQQEKDLYKSVIEEVRQLALKQIDISNKEINKIRYMHHYDSHYKNVLIGQEQDLIKNQEKVLQILDKAKDVK